MSKEENPFKVVIEGPAWEVLVQALYGSTMFCEGYTQRKRQRKGRAGQWMGGISEEMM